MKTSPASSDTRRTPGRTAKLLLLLTMILAGALCAAPAAVTVIDDFDDGPGWESLLNDHGRIFAEVVDGQVHVTQALPPTSSCSHELGYARVFPIHEGRWTEFRLDVIRQSPGSKMVTLFVTLDYSPLRGTGGYGLYCGHNEVYLLKYWKDGWMAFAWESRPPSESPVTMILGFRREGDAVRLSGRLVLRDQPDHVIWAKEFVDGPERDASVEAGPDIGPPFTGPSMFTAVSVYYPQNSRADAVVDNFVCSEAEVPRQVEVLRTAETPFAMAWQGWQIPMESESPGGPWRPCNVLIDPERPGHQYCAPPTTASRRFFRLARGTQGATLCETGLRVPTLRIQGRATTGVRPALTPNLAARTLRIRGVGTRNVDFVLTNPEDTRWEMADSLVSLDLVEWDPAMLDGGIGILLRTATPQGVFYANDPIPDQHYSGLLILKRSDDLTQSELSITTPAGGESRSERFPAIDPTKDYRLQFMAIGDELTLQIFDLENLDLPIATCRATDDRIAKGLTFFHGTRASTDEYNVTLQRLVVMGTFPEP